MLEISCRGSTSYLTCCELQIVYDFVWILYVVKKVKVVYLTRKTIGIKPYILQFTSAWKQYILIFDILRNKRYAFFF